MGNHVASSFDGDVPSSLRLNSDSRSQSTRVSRRVNFLPIGTVTYLSLNGKRNVTLRSSSATRRDTGYISTCSQFEDDHADAPTVHLLVVMTSRSGVRNLGSSVRAGTTCRLREQGVQQQIGPHAAEKRTLRFLSVSMCLASPKSDTLTIRGYRLARSRFSGFKSRWTMPRECMY